MNTKPNSASQAYAELVALETQRCLDAVDAEPAPNQCESWGLPANLVAAAIAETKRNIRRRIEEGGK